MILSKVRTETPQLAPVEISSIILDSLEQVIGLFPSKKVEIEKRLDEAWILADPLLKEVFQNLFHNSIRLQEEDPWIGITVGREGDKIRIEICDGGPGIPNEMKNGLFKKYGMRTDKTRTGLGLSIVKSLVDRYNGTISVNDRISGDHSRGAVFVLEFSETIF
jgi:signal transduction histidine kinase